MTTAKQNRTWHGEQANLSQNKLGLQQNVTGVVGTIELQVMEKDLKRTNDPMLTSMFTLRVCLLYQF